MRRHPLSHVHSTPLDSYYDALRHRPLLSATEERALAVAIAAGDRAARDRMITANLRLVVKIARGFVGRGLAMDDLIGEGNLGLIRAVDLFDPSFGTRFSTYAHWWIKQTIQRAIYGAAKPVHIPYYLFALMDRWQRCRHDLAQEMGTMPAPDTVSAALGLTPPQEDNLRSATLMIEKITDDDDDWWQTSGPDNGEPPETPVDAADETRALYRCLDRLDARERFVLALRYGLEGETPQTLTVIGKRLGLTKERIRQIQKAAVDKLRDTARAVG